MSTDPEDNKQPARLSGPVRMCARCGTITREPVLIAEVHANSGPGWNVYACPDCAPTYPPRPDPSALLDINDRLNNRISREPEVNQ